MLPLVIGLHVACYGAYKDSPYETFIMRKFIREIVLVLIIRVLISFIFPSLLQKEKPYLVFAFILVVSRIVTEMYKLFIRVEDQNHYKIPSQVHFFRSVVKDRKRRFLLSTVVLFFLAAGVFLAYKIDTFQLPAQVKGLLTGLFAGLIIALGGAYKDGFFEGFSFR